MHKNQMHPEMQEGEPEEGDRVNEKVISLSVDWKRNKQETQLGKGAEIWSSFHGPKALWSAKKILLPDFDAQF